MASKLRESYASTDSLTQDTGEEGTYSADELAFAGVYAKAMASQLNEAKQVWDTAQDDGALGMFMAQQYRNTGTCVRCRCLGQTVESDFRFL